LGLAARRYCQRHQMRFTTSYHTQFPQYLRARFPIPVRFSYWALHRFHGAAVRCMVSTQSLRNELGSRGFRNLATWQRGVDTDVFKPGPKDFLDLPRPIAAYVGRVAVEKNIEAFLSMPWEGSKIVIGDGPERARLQTIYPHAVFTGFKFGEELAKHLACAAAGMPAHANSKETWCSAAPTSHRTATLGVWIRRPEAPLEWVPNRS